MNLGPSIKQLNKSCSLEEQVISDCTDIERQTLDTQTDEYLAGRMDCNSTKPEIRKWAFEVWANRNGSEKVQGFLAARLGRPYDDDWIKDLTAEAVLIAYENVTNGKFNYQKTTFSAYVTGIAYRNSCNQSRRLSREVYIAELETNEYQLEVEPYDLDQLAAKIMANKIYQRVSINEADLLGRRYVQEQSYSQMAADLGVEEGTLRQRFSRLLRCIGKRFKVEDS